MQQVSDSQLPPTLIKKLQDCRTLPSLPAIVVSILELARTPTAGTLELANLVAKDPSLSAKLLAAANSAFYAGSELKTLQQAVNRIGMEGALSLSLSFGLAFRGTRDSNGMDLDNFWKRALISGMVVRELQRLMNLRFDVETTYLAAVLQDIGMLALNEMDPDIYGVIYHSARSHRQLASFEEREYGTNHTQVGHWLCSRWGLPEKYTLPLLNSHQLPKEIDKTNAAQRVLALSGLMADPWLSSNQEMAMTLAYQASQDYLQMDERQFSHLLLHLQDKLPDIARLFEIKAPAQIDTFNLLQEAKHLLVERNLRMMQKLAQQQQEIDELRRNSEKLQEQLKKDPLTGIFNRQYTEKELQQHFMAIQQSGGSLAVVFIDLDYFKTLNDQYGHALGDSALKAFATALEQELESGCIAGRYGGEEFVALLPGFNQDEALAFARRLQEHLASTPLLSHNKEDIYVSASMGIAVQQLRDNAQPVFADADELVSAADQAMYNAKRTGRNRILLFTSGGQSQDLSENS
ncbi:sensor domain-containing diguanylate cyclase [Marinospirillum alkaliphilum]|uniref:diguanylate cyclase n=1 Tax=Marinospirillum alkaliphilum DSM 21637 TaxID=1122209 RepID=A0A1K1XL55_9GAMM|nr:GGDEF domain-containing protein [Marinospirillum alkaliphilum]SFX50336.1 diguanylate cyclase (GGDEF) domain-containing protein [Marinospirillum alkaliphilum DSM 21637]